MLKTSLALIFLLIIFFWRLFPTHLLVANDLHHISGSAYTRNFSLPYSWKEGESVGLGEYSVPTLWNWPVSLIFGIFANLNVPFQISLYVLGIVPVIVLSVVGILKIGNYYKLSTLSSVAGVVLYTLNSYILVLIDGGQLNLALAYSVIPLTFYFFRKLVESKTINNIFLFLLFVLLISFFDIRILYLLFIIFIFDFLFEIVYSGKFFKHLAIYLPIGVITAFTLIGIHAYWILPALLSKSVALPLNYDNPEQLSLLSFSSVGHSLLLLAPHWYKNIFGDITKLRLEFILIPVMSWLSLFLYKKDRRVGFWAVIALVGIFLSKGVNDPGGEIYQWLFVNIPGFSLFRDSTKFYFLITLSYAILISFTFEKIVYLLKKKARFYDWLLPIIIILYFSTISFPVYFGQMSGLFSKTPLGNDFFTLENVLKNDKDFGRVFWLPTKSPLGYSDENHLAVEATRLSQLRPFIMGTRGTYETFNYLREADYIGEILNVMGVKYIAYPYLETESRRFSLDDIKYYYLFSNQLKHLDWIDSRVDDSSIPVLKTKENQDRFFITPNLWFVVGSDDIYQKVLKDSIPLAQNSLVFLEENIGQVENINKYPEAKIVFNRKNPIDFALTFAKEEDFIAPSEVLKRDPDGTGWWKRDSSELLSWKTFLKEKYQLDYTDFDYKKGWSVAEGELTLQLDVPAKPKESMLFIRAMESSRSGTLSLFDKTKQIGQVLTKTSSNINPNLRWFDVGRVGGGSSEITLKAFGEINVVNALAIIDSEEWARYQQSTNDFKNRGMITDLTKLSTTNSAKVSYKRINSTKYEVTITDLINPTYLVFSESYDKLWKLNGNSPLLDYSMLNVYRIEKNGTYIMEYDSQKYVYIGLGVTLIFLLSTFIVYLYIRYSSHD